MKLRLRPQVWSTAVTPVSAPRRFGIATEGHDGLGGGDEEQVEQRDGVLADQGPQLRRQGEDDVEVAHRQRALHARRDPSRLSQGLALGAMAIAARVVDGVLVAAPAAHVAVPTERTRAADGDVPQRPALHGPERMRPSVLSP